MKKLASVLMVIAALILAGCSPEAEQFADLTVSVDSRVDRTIAPESGIKVDSYRLHYRYEGTDEVLTKDFRTTSLRLENIKTGNWIMSVEGLNADGTVIAESPEKLVTVVSSNDEPARFRLAYHTGKGTFSVSVSVPASETRPLTVNVVITQLFGNGRVYTYPLSEPSVSENGKVFSRSFTFDTGKYDLVLEMMGPSGEKIGIPYMESLHIYKDMTSSFEISWADGVFDKTAAPVFSLSPLDVQTDGSLLTLTSEPGAEIWYTTDGSVPTWTGASKYTSPILLDRNMTVKAFASLPCLARSETVSADYKVAVRMPEFSVEGGRYDSEQYVTLSCQTADASIYYTTDGSIPSPYNGTLYSSETITVSYPTSIRAIAVKSGLEDSEMAEAKYEFTNQNGNITVDGPEYYELTLSSEAVQSDNHGILDPYAYEWIFYATVTPLPENVAVTYDWYLDSVKIESEHSASCDMKDHILSDGAHQVTVKAYWAGQSLTSNMNMYKGN